MEEDKRLYPMRLCAIRDEYGWGTETFRLADLGYRDSLIHDGWLSGNAMSEVMDMYMDRVVGEHVFDEYGRQFPVCVRHLGVKGKMPLRVHPGDELAGDRYDFLGKEKFWYVTRAGKDARIWLGWKRDVDASVMLEACEDGSVEDLLNVVAPHAGQYFRIAPGTVHGAAGDMDIIEVSESSPLDFCVSSWGEEVSEDEFDPVLTLVDALDFIDYHKYRHRDSAVGGADPMMLKLMSIPQFDVCKIALKDPLKVSLGENGSFIVYVCAEGAATVQMEVLGQIASYRFGAGEAVLVPAECEDFILAPTDRNTVVLEVTVIPRSKQDPYIDESVDAELPELD